MSSTKNTLTSDEINAVLDAVKIHGRSRAKSAIRQAWFDGNYSNQCLDQHSSTLQNLRNRDGGRAALDNTILRHLTGSV
jgi:hypothetical protein